MCMMIKLASQCLISITAFLDTNQQCYTYSVFRRNLLIESGVIASNKYHPLRSIYTTFHYYLSMVLSTRLAIRGQLLLITYQYDVTM